MTFDIYALRAGEIELEEIGPAVPPAQLLSGNPIASRYRIHADGAASAGIWEVTPGEFISIKDDMTEVMHFVSGAGTIEHPDGSQSIIEPGAIVVVHPGWRGTWRVTETARKVFTAFRTVA